MCEFHIWYTAYRHVRRARARSELLTNASRDDNIATSSLEFKSDFSVPPVTSSTVVFYIGLMGFRRRSLRPRTPQSYTDDLRWRIRVSTRLETYTDLRPRALAGFPTRSPRAIDSERRVGRVRGWFSLVNTRQIRSSRLFECWRGSGLRAVRPYGAAIIV